jgi:hypothetical protein
MHMVNDEYAPPSKSGVSYGDGDGYGGGGDGKRQLQYHQATSHNHLLPVRNLLHKRSLAARWTVPLLWMYWKLPFVTCLPQNVLWLRPGMESWIRTA